MDESAIRRSLSAERRATLRRIEAMTRDFDGIVSAATDAGADDEHDPEGSTIAYERAQDTSNATDNRRVERDDRPPGSSAE